MKFTIETIEQYNAFNILIGFLSPHMDDCEEVYLALVDAVCEWEEKEFHIAEGRC